MHKDKTEHQGLFITFEGIDGSGKSTQVDKLKDYLCYKRFKVITLRDPGSTAISEKIRTILLDKENIAMSSWTELLLYESARAQLVEQIIKPALNEGKIVLCDRFYDSTTAYQGYARKLDMDIIRQANKIGSCGLSPHFSLFIDVKPEIVFERIKKIKHSQDRMESEGLEFQRAVRQGYLDIAERYPNRFKIIPGHESIENVHKIIINNLLEYFPYIKKHG